MQGDIDMAGYRLKDLSDGSGQQAATAAQLATAVEFLPVPIGGVAVIVTDGVNSYVGLGVCPSTDAPYGVAGHCFYTQFPVDATDMRPNWILSPGGTLAVDALSLLDVAVDAYDSVDIGGTLHVYDLAGTNYMQCSISLNAITSSSGSQTVNLTQTALSGTDLSLAANTITSTAGGSYFVVLQVNCSWD